MRHFPIPVWIAVLATGSWHNPATAQTSWRGLVVAPESRCSPYDADDYRYPQFVEDRVIAELGGVHGPYTGRWFASKRETDIEHIVARSEAHDSGLCVADEATRRRFATDLLNLTLASPGVNRNQKRARDAAEWLPDQNRCWFADRSVAVRRKYGLTIDQREADTLERVLSGCQSTDLVVVARGTSPVAQDITPTAADAREMLTQWDDNDDGRITCAEARTHGIAPVRRDHPAYAYMRDGDGDGIVCEAGGGEAKGGTARQGPAPAAAARSVSTTITATAASLALKHGATGSRQCAAAILRIPTCEMPTETELSASGERPVPSINLSCMRLANCLQPGRFGRLHVGRFESRRRLYSGVEV